jgi:cytochrome c-type biogenesis protein CcmE
MAASNRRTRKLKLLIGAAVIAACVAYLLYGGIQETIVFFVTPSELHAKGTSAYGKSLRLGGLVKEGSWTRSPARYFIRLNWSIIPPRSRWRFAVSLRTSLARAAALW